MIETSRNIHKLRGLLLETPMQAHPVMSVAKEMMLHGVNDREVFYFQQAAIVLLERVFGPCLHGHVEEESILKRLVARIRRNPGIDPDEVAGAVAPLILSVSQHSASSVGRESSQEEADRVRALLSRIPGFQEVCDKSQGETSGWRWVEACVEACILEQGRNQRREEREWQRRRHQLERMAHALIQACERIHLPTDVLHKAIQALEGTESLAVKLDAFVESLLGEAHQLKTSMDAARRYIDRAEAAIEELNGLFRKADVQLMQSRDEELLDIFTGLGNRFALTEHRKRYASGTKQVLLFVYCDEGTTIRPKIARSEVLRVLGFIGRRIQKMQIGLPFHIGNETIVVILSRPFVHQEIDCAVREQILDRLREAKGFPTHVNFGLAALSASGFSDEAVMLEEGRQLAKNSAMRGGQLLEVEKIVSDPSQTP
ncbi:MAG: hypothetical protein H7829_07670 [Magnetococcus sp. THC-1_WYH]